ncbi:DUF397 domain-containing protein [Saccharopolyspora sp. NPDC002376]
MTNWRKSSYSQGQGTCVEIQWRKSSYSPHNDNCVEVGLGFDAVGIRDTKDRDGGQLAVDPSRWHAFLRAIKDGALDQ